MPYKNVQTADGQPVSPEKVKGTDIVSTPPDPMEPIADKAMETIGQAKALIIRLLEYSSLLSKYRERAQVAGSTMANTS